MEIVEAIKAIEEISRKVNDSFGKLSVEQLNWKPSEDKWSVAQCLDHLIVSNSTYFPQFETVANGAYKKSMYQSIRFVSKFMGKWLVENTGPRKVKAMKNPPAFAPTIGNLPQDIVQKFLTHQIELVDKLHRMNHCDIHETILTSPALSVITYSLSDLLQIISGHEERHYLQALKVLALQNT